MITFCCEYVCEGGWARAYEALQRRCCDDRWPGLLLSCFSCSFRLCFPNPSLIFFPSVNLVLIQLFLSGAQAADLAGPTGASREMHWSFLLLVFPFSFFLDQPTQQYPLICNRKPTFLVIAHSSCHLLAPWWLLGPVDTSAKANSISKRCSGEAFSSARGFGKGEPHADSGHSPSPLPVTMWTSGPSRGLDAGVLLWLKGLLTLPHAYPPVGIHSCFGGPYGKGVPSL